MYKITVYDSTGSQNGTVEIVSNQPEQYTASAYAVSIRSLRQSWRQGTVGHKTRAEVSMSNKKPWKQKGTGRARAGSARSPLWRKGGVIFGPEPRTRVIKISRRQRQLALKGAMHELLAANKFYCLDVAFGQKPSVKTAHSALKALGIVQQKIVVFLPFDDVQTYLSFRNIPNVHVVFYDQVNAFDLTNGQSWVFLKKDVNLFTDMVARWN